MRGLARKCDSVANLHGTRTLDAVDKGRLPKMAGGRALPCSLKRKDANWIQNKFQDGGKCRITEVDNTVVVNKAPSLEEESESD